MDEIMLSIICTTYNHEKYLKKALDSVFMQKVDFKYEVLLGEDCSTDNSRMIIKQYEKKYPQLKVFYRKVNYGAKKNFADLYAKAIGKYIIVLETDDFWIADDKLQKQVDFLENNSEYIAIAHKSIMVDDDGKLLYLKYPECNKKEYTFKDFVNGKFAGQTTSIMHKNIYNKKNDYNIDFLMKDEYDKGPGDRKKMFFLLSNGRVRCLQEYLSAYRFVNSKGSSFTATQRKKQSNILDYKKMFMEYSHKNNIDKKAKKAAECLYMNQLIECLVKKSNKITMKIFIQEVKKFENKGFCLYEGIKYVGILGLKRLIGGNRTYSQLKKSDLEIIRSVYKEG